MDSTPRRRFYVVNYLTVVLHPERNLTLVVTCNGGPLQFTNSKPGLTERFGLNGSSVRTNWERRLFCLRVNSSVKHAKLPAEYHTLTDIQLTSTRSGGETSVAPGVGLALSYQDRCLARDHALIQCFIIPKRKKPRWVDKASEITFCIFILSRAWK